MHASTGNNRTVRRVFRRHRFINLTLPGLPWLGTIALLVIAFFCLVRDLDYAPLFLTLAGFPIFKLLQLYLAWMSYSVTAITGSSVLVERSGLLGGAECCIPLSDFVTIERKNPWWASLLGIDVGDAVIWATGGPFVLRSMGGLADLWTVFQSRGQIVPPKRRPAWVALLKFLTYSAVALLALIAKGFYKAVPWMISRGHSVIDLLEGWFGKWPSLVRRLRQVPRYPAARTNTARPAGQAAVHPAVPNDSFIYEGQVFSPLALSYAGFCAFCHQFVLNNRNWAKEHYLARDPSRQYYPNGISDPIACFYLRRLYEAFVLIPKSNGHLSERLSSRIRSIADIRRLVPDLYEPSRKAA